MITKPMIMNWVGGAWEVGKPAAGAGGPPGGGPPGGGPLGGAAGPPGLPGDCGRVAGEGDLVVLYLCRERDASKKLNNTQ
jgi:hypothetical protein